ncbi:MAG: hypothetical protein PHC61_15505, partial [Chitinivibrionales bacterium]|nr:hypothetical protein [Chitinivibrionales bacterium]
DFIKRWRSADFEREIGDRVSQCRGCMYACYPEFAYMLGSRAFFLKRVLDYRALAAPKRPPLTPDIIRNIIAALPPEIPGGAAL